MFEVRKFPNQECCSTSEVCYVLSKYPHSYIIYLLRTPYSSSCLLVGFLIPIETVLKFKITSECPLTSAAEATECLVFPLVNKSRSFWLKSDLKLPSEEAIIWCVAAHNLHTNFQRPHFLSPRIPLNRYSLMTIESTQVELKSAINFELK